METMEGMPAWSDDFERFCERFYDLFPRSETREQFRDYLRGLLTSGSRKTIWRIAEAAGKPDPKGLQHLLGQAHWDADALRDRLQQFILERFGDPSAICVLTESGFVKKGGRSVGVHRQWCRTLPYGSNCQVGLFLGYVAPHGTTIADRRLYLPEAWCRDRKRRQAADVPDRIEYAPRPVLGRAMLEHARQQGLPMRWVVGDEEYGDSPALRDAITRRGLGYVLAVSSQSAGWREAPMGAESHGVAGSAPEQTVAALAAKWPDGRWIRLDAETGAEQPADWACGRVIGRRDEELWLIARRDAPPPRALTYYLSNAPRDTPLAALARVAAARRTAMESLQACCKQAGLGDYEVRLWHSWHRHITLALAAYAWLVSISPNAPPMEGPS